MVGRGRKFAEKKKPKKKSTAKFKRSNDRCCNPFNLRGHKGNNLRNASKTILAMGMNVRRNDMICHKCRKHGNGLYSTTNNHESHNETHAIAVTLIHPNTRINQKSNTYRSHEQEICEGANNSRNSDIEGMNALEANETCDSRADDYKIMFEKLKKKFSECDENDPLRVQILTLVPDNWTLQRTAEEFQTTQWLARKARILLENEGVFGKVEEKRGKNLSPEIEKKINLFYNSDDISRVMPSTKETVTMKVDGVKRKVQKRLLLLSLKELFRSFKEENPTTNVGFSTFAKHRPKNCILPGQSGTHSVCVCTIHQNVKTMLDAIDLSNLTSDEEIKLSNYKDCLRQLVCSCPTEKCFLNECEKCPSSEKFCEYLRRLLSKSYISEVKYAVWTETDRATLLTIQESTDDYIDNLLARLESLKPHSFIVKKQSEYIKLRRSKLAAGEVMVCFDFSENYAFVAQDAAQAFHYNNDQSTVFPVVYYYKKGSDIIHKSCIFLSESTKHDSASVHTILHQLIPEIGIEVPKVKRIIYVSDGAKQHFKNRFQMANLLQHKQDFGIVAEWHFTPTAHGKGAHDGLASSFKREARRASLKAKPTDALLTVNSLYNWAKSYYKSIKIFYFSEADHNRSRRKLKARFDNAAAVYGIMKHHSFKVTKDNKLEMKYFSVFT